jgi:SAM-dependent methyltransferase
MNKPSAVKEFYNNFIDQRMIDYRLYGNYRISEAAKFARKYVSEDSNILDIGCGIGIATEAVSQINKNGSTWACDISDKNIAYAKKTVSNKRISFFVADIINDFELIEKIVTSPIDIVMMIDVIEHLPPGKLEFLFKNFSTITSENGLVVLAYPSPEYQDYLRVNQPEELQVIDENIYISELEKYAMKSGFKLMFFNYQDLGRKNQYIYCVFSKNLKYTGIYSINNLAKVSFWMRKVGSRLILPILKYKYLYKPFKEND